MLVTSILPNLASLTYAGRLYVATGFDGFGGVIAYSPDGIQWTAGLVSTRKELLRVADNGETYVGVGDAGAIVMSKDGLAWLDASPGPRDVLHDIDSDGSTIVAVGNRGAILSSTDESRWIHHDLGVNAALTRVTHGQGLFVVTGNDYNANRGMIFTSADGVEWTERVVGTVPLLYGAAYGGGRFVVTTRDGGVVTSTDGANWSHRPGALPDALLLPGLIWADGKFVAVGYWKQRPVVSATSTNGLDWALHEGPWSTGLYGLAYGKGRFVATGANGAILFSTDAAHWTETQFRWPGTLEDVHFAFGWFVCAAEHNILFSDDAVLWQSVPLPVSVSGITAFGDHFLAAGSQGSILVAGPMGPALWAERAPPGNRAFLRIFGPLGMDFTLESSANLREWAPVADGLLQESEATMQPELSASERGTFFRLRRR